MCLQQYAKKHNIYYVMDGKKPVNLLGRDDSVDLVLIKRVHVTVDDACKNLVTRYADVSKIVLDVCQGNMKQADLSAKKRSAEEFDSTFSCNY